MRNSFVVSRRRTNSRILSTGVTRDFQIKCNTPSVWREKKANNALTYRDTISLRNLLYHADSVELKLYSNTYSNISEYLKTALYSLAIKDTGLKESNQTVVFPEIYHVLVSQKPQKSRRPKHNFPASDAHSSYAQLTHEQTL